MSTDAQIEANRANSDLSTGPNTPEGKASSRFNALKHGLRAKSLVLKSEEREAFEELADALRQEFPPSEPAQEILVKDLAVAAWRMQRAQEWSTSQIESFCAYVRRNAKMYDIDGSQPDQVLSVVLQRAMHRQQLETMDRTEIRCRRAFYQALDRLQRTKNSPVEKSATIADKPFTS